MEQLLLFSLIGALLFCNGLIVLIYRNKRFHEKESTSNDEVIRGLKNQLDKWRQFAVVATSPRETNIENFVKHFSDEFLINAIRIKWMDIEDLRLRMYKAMEERDRAHADVLMWERLMMELVKEDGPGSVRTAITNLKGQHDAFQTELNMIRKIIGANPEESTYDEVERVVSRLKKHANQ